MAIDFFKTPYKRRKILYFAGLATGVAILPPAFNLVKTALSAYNARQTEALSLKPLPRPNGVSKVVIVHTEDRVAGTQRALDLLQPTGIQGKSIFLKPNFNTADPAPGATDPKLLEALIKELQNAKVGQITLGDRSGMAETRYAMEQKGAFKLAERYGLKAVVLDELPVDQWQFYAPTGTHWKQGFAIARPALDADAVVSTCCLKTHGGVRAFTLSLKNSVGLVAKRVPGDFYNYMKELHKSEHLQQMVAEVNAAYNPAFILMDGVEAFVKGGPDKGEKVSAKVILAGTDRVAVDVVALGILRSFGTSAEVSGGSVWDLGQIRRATELGIGISQGEQIELITADGASQKIADSVRRYIMA
jgi:uncharacterized protein (DUF362 family)